MWLIGIEQMFGARHSWAHGGILFEIFIEDKTAGTAKWSIALERLPRLVLCASGACLRFCWCGLGAGALWECAECSVSL